MKKIGLIFIMILSWISLYAQPSCEIVNIYIIPYGYSPVISPDLTPDYLRVHAETKITINNPILIDSLRMKINNLKQNKIYSYKREEFNQCRTVIDFVRGNYIYKSISINDGLEYILDNGFFNREVTVYEGETKFMCYLKSLFPKFIEAYPNMIKCK